MRKKLELIIPPGYGTEKIFTFWCIGLVLCLLITSTFFITLESKYSKLEDRYDGDLNKMNMKEFHSFYYFLGEEEFGFESFYSMRESCYTLLAELLLIFVPMHYVYYYRETKNIYTMRRLGKPLELHIRAWVLPLILFTLTLLLRACMILLLYACYLNKTKLLTIPPDQWDIVWRLIIYDRIN